MDFLLSPEFLFWIDDHLHFKHFLLFYLSLSPFLSTNQRVCPSLFTTTSHSFLVIVRPPTRFCLSAPSPGIWLPEMKMIQKHTLESVPSSFSSSVSILSSSCSVGGGDDDSLRLVPLLLVRRGGIRFSSNPMLQLISFSCCYFLLSWPQFLPPPPTSSSFYSWRHHRWVFFPALLCWSNPCFPLAIKTRRRRKGESGLWCLWLCPTMLIWLKV